MDKRLFDKHCRYSIRKFTVGTASVLIGFSFLGAQQVLADELAPKVAETESVNTDGDKIEEETGKPASLQAGNLPKESSVETSTAEPAAELPKEVGDNPRIASGEERAGDKAAEVSQPASAPVVEEVASPETAQDGTVALEDHFTASQPVDKAKVELAVKSPEYLEKNYTVFPKPRQFDYQEGVTRLDGRVDLVAAPNVDIYTLNRAKSILKDHQISYDRVATAQDGNQKLYLGIHGENSEAEKKQAQSGIAKDLYDKIDAYSLVVKDGEISIVGKDTDAVFYGLTTLKHLLNENPLPVLRNMSVQDYADVKNRGFIEGYYGNPWSNANRMELMRYGGDLKLTQYFFAPKDDPYHNSRWWELYPEEQLQGIRDLARTGNQTKTRYVWTMHPFMHRPVRFTDDKVYHEDLGKIQAKFTQLLNAGVREFGILADDARPPQGVGYAGYTRLMTDLSKWLESKKADYQGLKTDMIFVPSQYMDSGQSAELRALNKDLPETAHLVLTGGKVWGATENTFLQTLKKNLTADGSTYRPVQMWMNWPTTDGTKNHLILGDGEKYLYPGVDPTMIRGVMLNPMQQSEPSKIALFSVAQYTWQIWPSVQESRHTNEIAFNFAENGRFEDSKESAAFRELGKHMRNQNRPAYVTRLDESIELAPKLHAFMDKLKAGQDVTADREQLRAEFAKIKDAAIYYKAHGRKEMVDQIHYWLDNTVDQMEAVDHLLTATEKMATTDRAGLWQHYHQGVELYKQSKNHPFWYLDHYENAELGVQHIRPFILGLQDILAKAVEQDLHPDKVFTNFITNRKDAEGRLADVEDGDKQTHIIFKNPNSIAKGDYVGLEFNQATDLHQLTFVMGTNANIHDTFSKAELQYMDEAGQWQKLASKIVGNEETIHLTQLDIKAKGVRLIATEPRTNVWLAVREIAVNKPITSKPSQKEQVKVEISSNIIYKQNTTSAQMLDSNANTETMLSNADTSESKKNITPAQAWVRLDLGAEKDIQKIHLLQGTGDKLAKGLIEISKDDKTWTKVADLTGEQEKTIEDKLQARYVRVQNLEDLHKWWRIADFSVEAQSGNLELNDSNVDSLKSLPVAESLGRYELKIPAGTSLLAHTYLGMKLGRLHELKTLSLVGEKNEALLLEYSPNGQEWYRENAVSAQQRARYIRLSNPTDQAQDVKASSLVVETKEVMPPSLQSTTMGINPYYGANDVRKLKNLDQLFDGVYNNFVEFSDYAHKDGNIVINLGNERTIKKIRAYIQDGTQNYLRDGKIQVSQDGKTWTDVVTVGDGQTNAVHDDSLTDGWTHDSKMPGNRYIGGQLASPVKANYLRVLFTADYNARFVGFTELVINDGEFVKPVNNPTVEGTGAESRDNLMTNLVDGKVLTSYKASEDKGELLYHLSENTAVNHIRLVSDLPKGTRARVLVRTATQDRDSAWQDLGAVKSSFQTFVVKTEKPQVLDVKLAWDGGKPEFYELSTFNKELTAEELAEPQPNQPAETVKPEQRVTPILDKDGAIAKIIAATKAKETEFGDNAPIKAELEEGLAFTKSLIQAAPDQASIDTFVASYLDALKEYKVTPETPDKPGETTEQSKPSEIGKPVDEGKPVETPQPNKPSEEAKPTETVKPEQPTKPAETPEPSKTAEDAKPTETVKPDQPSKPVETPQPNKPSEEAKPTETAKPEQPTKPAETPEPSKPAEGAKPSETVKPEQPGKPVETPESGKPSEEAKPAETVKSEQPTNPVETPEPGKPTEEVKPSETVKPEQPAKPAETSQPDTNSVTPDRELKFFTDKATGVMVVGNPETVGGLDHLEVQKVGDQALAGKSYDAFDIKLKDKDNHEIQPNGAVLVRLPVKAGAEVENVFYVTPSKELQALNFTQKGDVAEFTTTHFSIYAVVYKQATPTAETMSTKETSSAVKATEDKPTLPNTGDSSNASLLFLASLSLALSALFYVKGRKD